MTININGTSGISGVDGSAATPAIQGTDTNTGISFGTDEVNINTGGTAAVTVDSSQRVGIGTTSPGHSLDVAAGNSTVALNVRGRSSDNIGSVYFRSNDTASTYGYIQGRSNEFRIASDSSSQPIVFHTDAEKARIDSSGNLGIGTTSPQAKTHIVDSAVTGTSYNADDKLVVENDGTCNINLISSTTGSSFLLFSDTTRARGSISYNHTNDYTSIRSAARENLRIYGNSIYSFSNVAPWSDNTYSSGESGARWSAVWAANGTIQTSDQREKTEITNSSLGSDFIKSLRPVSYKWVEGGKRDTGEVDEENHTIYESVPGERTHWGFLAQEVKQAVDAAGVDFGGWVLTDKDDPDSQQALRYDQFIAPLTKALQEALAKIETLETRLAALEGGTN